MAYTDHRLDRELFHAWLWYTRGRRNVITMSHKEMAEWLKCGPQTPSRMYRELIAAGKVTKIRNGSFRVNDPAETKILK